MSIKPLLGTVAITSALYAGGDYLYRSSLREVNQCVLNDGIAFGIDIIPMRLIYLLSIILISVTIIFFSEMYAEDKDTYQIDRSRVGEYTAYAMIISGASVNLVERLLFGNICDYLSLPLYGNLLVNMSDILVVSGFVGLMYIYRKDILQGKQLSLLPGRSSR